MAYVPQEEDKEKQQGQSGSPSVLGGAPSSGSPTHSNFVNVSEYLSKNPNEGEDLTNRVVGNLESQKADTQNSINDASTQFGSRVDSGTVRPDADLLTGAFSSPETFVKDPNNVAKFMAMRDAAYTGPKSLQDTDLYGPAQTKLNALKATGTSVGTEAGRNALLSPLSEHPTAGKTALNQMILQGTPDAAKRLQDEAGTFGAVDQQWQDVINSTGAKAAQGEQMTNQARTDTQAGLKGATDTFSKDLSNKTAKATNERDAFNTQYQALLHSLMDESGLTLKPADLKALGIENAYPYLSRMNEYNQDMGEFGTPVNLGSYTSPGRANSNIPTAASVASSDDYAREAALQQLSGQDLGLPDQQGEMYQPNGALPTVDYMGAFNAAGSGLSAADRADLQAHGVNIDRSIAENKLYGWVPRQGYDPANDVIHSQIALGRLHTPDFYTSPNAQATPPQDFGQAPPPAGWDPNQPAPYPQPTSPPPEYYINPTWDPYQGIWTGITLQPTNPPPSSGGGHVWF